MLGLFDNRDLKAFIALHCLLGRQPSLNTEGFGVPVFVTSVYGDKGRELILAEVRVGKNETLDTALKRFKRSCAKDGVIAEVRKREHYEKPSVKRKKKSEAARKRKY